MDQVLLFQPTGWVYEQLKDRKPPEEAGVCNYQFSRSGNVICYGLPYSEHSSFEELREFLKRVHYREYRFVAESGPGDLFGSKGGKQGFMDGFFVK